MDSVTPTDNQTPDASVAEPRGPSRDTWIAAAILILIGVIFLLQNVSPFRLQNWWALFILIPVVTMAGSAWRAYLAGDRRISREVVGPAFASLILLAVSVTFLLDLSWHSAWPLILIIVGLGALISSLVGWTRESPDGPVEGAEAQSSAEQGTPPKSGRRLPPYRSSFWPVIFISIGLAFLLVNVGIVSVDRVIVLARLWPLLLVVVGLDLVIGRRSPVRGALLGLAVAAVMVITMAIGPSLGWAGDSSVKTERFKAPLASATSASVDLDLSNYPTTVFALSGSEALIEANLSYRGQIRFHAAGEEKKVVSLSRTGSTWLDLGRAKDLKWSIGLSPRIPVALAIKQGSAQTGLDLSALRLSSLKFEGGSGATEMTLPQQAERQAVGITGESGSISASVPSGTSGALKIKVGSGSVTLRVGTDSDVEVRLDGGAGEFSMSAPVATGVRIQVLDSGSGKIRAPVQLVRVESAEADQDVWESSGFASAKHKVVLIVEHGGSGDIELRHN